MSTVLRYTGNPDGYMDFYMGEELISCQSTIGELGAQSLWDAITEVEDNQLAFGFLGIANADGKNAAVNTALNVNLLRSWRVGTEKTSGAFKLFDGNVTSETLGTEPFEPNNLVFMTNQLAQFGSLNTITTGSGLTAEQSAMLSELWTKQQLNPADPFTVDFSTGLASSQSGDIEIDLTGDGIDTATGTRR